MSIWGKSGRFSRVVALGSRDGTIGVLRMTQLFSQRRTACRMIKIVIGDWRPPPTSRDALRRTSRASPLRRQSPAFAPRLRREGFRLNRDGGLAVDSRIRRFKDPTIQGLVIQDQ